MAQTGPPAPDPPVESSAAAWQHPVDAPVLDYFRPPSHRYGPGNRGLAYDTTRGQTVSATAAGEVVFAGPVGGQLFAVVAHDPSLRSTYAYLQRIDVSVGQTVHSGDRIGIANPGFHLTARLNGRYVDPLNYLGFSRAVRLIPLWSTGD